MSAIEFQVWWIPQVPMEAFTFDVMSRGDGLMLCDALAKYDAFQFENHIKPDYCNTGGVRFRHAELTGAEWWDVPEDDEEWNDLLMEISAANANAESAA